MNRVRLFVAASVIAATLLVGAAGSNAAPFHGGLDIADIAVAPDGGVAIAIRSGSPAVGMRVIRFNPDGSLDQSFGRGGQIRVRGDQIALAPDNSVVVGGSVRGRRDRADLLISRYTENGRVDRTFSGDGRVRLNSGLADFVDDMAIVRGGRIAVAAEASCFGADPGCGTTFSAARLVLLRPNGKVRRIVRPRGGTFHDVSLTPEKGLVAGLTDTGGGHLVERFTPGGGLDPAFGDKGTVRIGSGGIRMVPPDHVAAHADGGTLVTPEDGRVQRLTPDGRLDSAFGGSGVAACQSTQATTTAHSDIFVDSAARIVVAGGEGDCGLARYLANGTIDPSFSGDGHLNPVADAGTFADVMASGGAGRVLIAGWARRAGEVRVVRLLPDGSLDPTFGTSGRAAFPVPG